MKPLVVITLVLLAGSPVYGQDVTKAPQTNAAPDQAFEEYCLKNAVQIISVPAGKADDLKMAGEVTLLGQSATYRDYGISLKENETQYFRIAGSSQLLLVTSLVRLRANYNASNNIKTTR